MLSVSSLLQHLLPCSALWEELVLGAESQPEGRGAGTWEATTSGEEGWAPGRKRRSLQGPDVLASSPGSLGLLSAQWRLLLRPGHGLPAPEAEGRKGACEQSCLSITQNSPRTRLAVPTPPSPESAQQVWTGLHLLKAPRDAFGSLWFETPASMPLFWSWT